MGHTASLGGIQPHWGTYSLIRGHIASLGCNKCLRRLAVSCGQPNDFSHYDRENWTIHTGQMHRCSVQEIMMETTTSGLAAGESRLGVRYSILLHLPYLNPVRLTVIDVMHNLFLGTSERIFEL